MMGIKHSVQRVTSFRKQQVSIFLARESSTKVWRFRLGYFTGKCVPSYENETVKVCEMRGWCPEELSKST